MICITITHIKYFFNKRKPVLLVYIYNIRNKMKKERNNKLLQIF